MDPSPNKQVDLFIDVFKDQKVRQIKSTDLQPSKITTVVESNCGMATLSHKILDNKVEVIAKEFNYDKIDWTKLSNELVIVSTLVHDHIPKFQGIVFEDTSQFGKKKVILVTEHIDGKSLNDYKLEKFEGLSDEDKLRITKDLCSILTFVHEKDSMHRDLNPLNLIIDKTKKVYLTNFGFGKVLDDGEKATRTTGTVNYSPPESVDDIDAEDGDVINLVTAKYDVWAFGCVVSLLFSGDEPWNTKSNAMISKKLKDKVNFPINKNKINNDNIVKIIKMCTEVDVKNRCNMKDVKAILDKM